MNTEDIQLLRDKFLALQLVKSNGNFFLFLEEFVIFLKKERFFEPIDAVMKDKELFYKDFWSIEKKVLEEFDIISKFFISLAKKNKLLLDEPKHTNPIFNLQSLFMGSLHMSGKFVFNVYNLLNESCEYFEKKGLLKDINIYKQESKWIFSGSYEKLLELYEVTENQKKMKLFYFWESLSVIPEISSWGNWLGSGGPIAEDESLEFYLNYLLINFGRQGSQKKDEELEKDRFIYFDYSLRVFQYILDWHNYLFSQKEILCIDSKGCQLKLGEVKKVTQYEKDKGPWKCINLLSKSSQTISVLSNDVWGSSVKDRARVEISKINKNFRTKMAVSVNLIIPTGKAGEVSLNNKEFQIKNE